MRSLIQSNQTDISVSICLIFFIKMLLARLGCPEKGLSYGFVVVVVRPVNVFLKDYM